MMHTAFSRMGGAFKGTSNVGPDTRKAHFEEPGKKRKSPGEQANGQGRKELDESDESDMSWSDGDAYSQKMESDGEEEEVMEEDDTGKEGVKNPEEAKEEEPKGTTGSGGVPENVEIPPGGAENQTGSNMGGDQTEFKQARTTKKWHPKMFNAVIWAMEGETPLRAIRQRLITIVDALEKCMGADVKMSKLGQKISGKVSVRGLPTEWFKLEQYLEVIGNPMALTYKPGKHGAKIEVCVKVICTL